ncbi:50S ribosomal protein L3 [Natronogracilivirga saccharolytica]|uniref:Large ribosomal subunit protein uL3 n=1 Tax=Natronogracilivirga saccharolytica TaxID=2812953 RepID=A0A8J7UV69_9BACT|nr:50S ribosomal protein L3 [Natronogracilivirga saccharolytica]MBP3192257.1 50S ribosomal protein L3 [Natronogracilivirga saccharolytica]
MTGLIGKKIGMTNVFDDNGNNVPVTVVEVEPCVITQIKSMEVDGYDAIQIAAVEKKEKNVSKALRGHFAKANTSPKRYIREMRDFVPEGAKVGDTLKIDDVFRENTYVDVVGTTKGKGFQGVVKRHGFSGVGGQTHGQKDRERAPGSIGQSADPSKVFKGIKMGGQDGNSRVKVKRLQLMKVLPESNLILIKGAIPGPKNRLVEVYNHG